MVVIVIVVIVVIVIVDGVDVVLSAVCISGKFSFFLLPLFLSLSLCLLFCRHFLFDTGVPLRFTALPVHLPRSMLAIVLWLPPPPFLSRSATRCCQPENVNLSHEHVRIFSMRLGLGDDLFSGARWMAMKVECEGGTKECAARPCRKVARLLHCKRRYAQVPHTD